MEKESDPNLYEISYLGKADDEGQAVTLASLITDAVEQEKGIMASQIHPSRKTLSYPIKKEEEGWWGVVKFMLKPENVLGLEERLRGVQQIFRFAIFKITKADVIDRPRRKLKTTAQAPEKTDIAEIDKKLEEILGS